MKYFPKIRGTRLYLSPISLEDAETYTQWLNDLETTRYLTLASAQLTLQGEREHLPAISSGHTYAIVEKEQDRLIGNCGLMDLEATNRTAEVGIFIGAPEARGKGYGSEALRLLCDYAFNVLNLRSLVLRTYDYNERAIASYRKVGFKEIGRRRQAHFYAGAYHDLVYMDLLAEELGPSVLPPAQC
ncbi:MAG TPA: GNAT family protein [Spirochaetales bacterium]|nr:GNAT family protein [Spirochaetales bacterium]HRY55961.1 GNAT family protein [Spirochaetia bacterium]HRZ65530.1 GNAT family protein [Spirochaetia bacterium]